MKMQTINLSEHMTLRRQILDTARKLFNEKGYDHVPMRMISDSLGISVGNLTYHFKRKEHIVIAIMNEDVQDSTLDAPVEHLAQLNSIFSLLLDALLRNPFYFLDEDVQAILGEQDNHNTMQVQGQLNIALDSLILHGLIDPSFSGTLRKSVISILLLSHITWLNLFVRCPEKECMTKEEFLDAHWTILSSYLTASGKKELDQMREKQKR